MGGGRIALYYSAGVRRLAFEFGCDEEVTTQLSGVTVKERGRAVPASPFLPVSGEETEGSGTRQGDTNLCLYASKFFFFRTI